jgi:hypothetical protein
MLVRALDGCRDDSRAGPACLVARLAAIDYLHALTTLGQPPGE